MNRFRPGAWGGNNSDPMTIARFILRPTNSAAVEQVAALLEAAMGLGAMPEGYCFCSADRIGDDSKAHEPECRDLRTAIAETGAA